jgi:hypothetical protein
MFRLTFTLEASTLSKDGTPVATAPGPPRPGRIAAAVPDFHFMTRTHA